MMVWPTDRLTRFEVARIIGARALQISLGAPILVETDKVEPIDIAKEEFKQAVLPITVKRKLPNKEEVVVEIKKAIRNWLEENKGEI